VSGETAGSSAVSSYWPEERTANIALTISWIILSSEWKVMSKGFAISMGNHLELKGSRILAEYKINQGNKETS
jgi:hypothetical protein